MWMVVIQACNFRPLTASSSMLSRAHVLMQSSAHARQKANIQHQSNSPTRVGRSIMPHCQLTAPLASLGGRRAGCRGCSLDAVNGPR